MKTDWRAAVLVVTVMAGSPGVVTAQPVSIKPGRESGSILVELKNATPMDVIETLAAKYDITVQGSLDTAAESRLIGRWEGTIVDILERALRSQSYVLGDGLSRDGAPRRIVLVATRRPGGAAPGARIPGGRLAPPLPPAETPTPEEPLEEEAAMVEEPAEEDQQPNSGARGP